MPDASGAQPSVFRTPTGLSVLHLNQREVQFVYKEIFEDRLYLRHGVSLFGGSTVIDVGANIGLFTMFVQQEQPGCRVIAIEPCPPIFSLMTSNTERYGRSVSRFQCGISDKDASAIFTYYPDYSIMSGFQTDAERDTHTLKAGIRNQWRTKFPKSPAMGESYVDGMVQAVLGRKQTYVCQLRPLSTVLREAGDEEIGLLKIDTEGSEMQVLSGIDDAHWPKIAQIVIEIHDASGRLTNPVIELLTHRGFHCTVEEEAALRGSGVANCYAIRL